MSYLIEFGDFVSKASGATSLGDVVIHKHNGITIRKETQRFPKEYSQNKWMYRSTKVLEITEIFSVKRRDTYRGVKKLWL
jgi:hypothetical protein